MKPARRPRRMTKRRAAIAACLAGAFGIGAIQLGSGCQQSPTVVPVRSMSASGKVSFVCLHPLDPPERPLEECTAQLFTSICQYEYEDDAGAIDANVIYDDAGVAQATLYPHLYALVTQENTGEVAVVDTSAIAGGVLDENPTIPGANFLPVGAKPKGIASTPGSVATFVGAAELGKEGIYAIPSSRIRPAESWGQPDICIGPSDASVVPPVLSTWPACYLGSAPGDVLLIDDPALADGLQRPTCDSAYSLPTATDTIALKESFHGRSKLVVAMPDKGGIAILDAQTVLNAAPGSFDACTIERWVPLTVDLTGLAGVQALPTGLGGGSCANPAISTPALASSYPARPGGMSYANGKLYIADLTAPVIHVVSMESYIDGLGETPTPCNPIEEAPLLPTSLDEPQRVVFSSKVTAAPVATTNFKQYLYATDVEDGSLMLFDIGPNSTSRRPLQRTTHPEWNPFQPRDRVRFSAPAADILLAERDLAAIDPVSGVATNGTVCDPDPNAVTCVATSHNCDNGTSYRTSSDYTLGAGPQKLRGQFAFAALSNGKVAVIDIDDFDAPCRGPEFDTGLSGCSSNASGLITSQEISCNVVSFGEPRAADYLAVGSLPGNHVPGIETFPLLYASDGSVVVDTDTQTAPKMVATLPASGIPASCLGTCDPLGCGSTCDILPGCPLELFVGGTQTPLDVSPGQCATACEPNGAPCSQDADCCTAGAGGSTCNKTSGACEPKTCLQNGAACDQTIAGTTTCTAANCNFKKCSTDGTACNTSDDSCSAQNCSWSKPSANLAYTPGGVAGNNALAMNLEDPRVHVIDQNWTVSFEGIIPGFTQKLAAFSAVTPSATAPWSALLTDPNSQFCDHGILSQKAFEQMLTVQPKPGNKLTPVELADYVQIVNNIPDATDTYWTDVMGATNACDYATCFSEFGATDTPELNTSRDLLIYEAYQDHLELVPRGNQVPNVLNLIQCCFPGATTFNVRVGNQWDVVGDQTGFIHHVVTDAVTGVCRNDCDPTLSRKNARLTETVPTLFTAPILDRTSSDIDPSPAFQNPMFRFAITTGEQKCTAETTCGKGALCSLGVCAVATADTPSQSCKLDSDCHVTSRCDTTRNVCVHPGAVVTVATQRDTQFRFSTNGSFVPLQITLATDSTSLIEPQSITYLGPTTEVAVTDGYQNGLIMVSLQTATVSRSFF